MSNRARSGRYSRVPGPFRVRVTSRRVVDGQAYYTAVNERTSEVYPWCVLLADAGGSASVFVHAPVAFEPEAIADPTRGPEALLTFDTKGAAYLSGISPVAQQADLVEEPVEIEDNEAHPGTFTPRDYVVANGKARLLVDQEGNVLVKACRSLRLQVGDDEGEGGRVVVFSTQGQTLSDVVVFDPLRDYLVETQNAKIDELSEKLAEICNAMRLAGTSSGFSNPFALPGGPSHTHTPLEEPGEDIATPFLSAPQRPGAETKEGWD